MISNTMRNTVLAFTRFQCLKLQIYALFLKIYPPHPLAHPREYLIGNSLRPMGQLTDWQFFTKDHHLIPLLHVHDPRNIDHRHIHTNAANDGRQPPLDPHFAHSIPQPPWIAVRIPYPHRGDHRILTRNTPPVVPYRLPLPQLLDLGDG